MVGCAPIKGGSCYTADVFREPCFDISLAGFFDHDDEMLLCSLG